MVEAISHIRRQRGREVLLQVEQANAGAISLYQDLGFATLGTMNQWEAPAGRLRPLALSQEPQLDIRPLAGRDWRQAIDLDLASLPANLNWPVPPQPTKYRTGLLRWLNDTLNGRKAETWLARPAADEVPAGLASIRMEWGRPHRLEVRVAPAWRGQQLERPLLAKLLRRLTYLRRAAVQVHHPAADGVMAELLPEANFQLRRSLTIMRLDMRGHAPGG
jgi:ribosomal protein S18 acetylase RimI-like enzyme